MTLRLMSKRGGTVQIERFDHETVMVRLELAGAIFQVPITADEAAVVGVELCYPGHRDQVIDNRLTPAEVEEIRRRYREGGS